MKMIFFCSLAMQNKTSICTNDDYLTCSCLQNLLFFQTLAYSIELRRMFRPYLGCGQCKWYWNMGDRPSTLGVRDTDLSCSSE